MNIKAFVKKEIVFCVSVFLAVASSLITCPTARMMLSFCDWRVIVLLFSLMLVIQAFKSENVLDNAAVWILRLCPSVRSLYFSFTFLVFFSSMAVTNDVALLTFVPLSILVCKMADIPSVMLVILETVAANLGSCVTPMGNPQNLFLYSFYSIPVVDFFKTTLVIAIPSFILLFVSVILITAGEKNKPFFFSKNDFSFHPVRRVRSSVYSVVMLVILLSVFRIIDYRIGFIFTLISILLCNRHLLKKVDYCLLMTFCAFFVFTKNCTSVPGLSSTISSVLKSPGVVFGVSIAASQVISNVPAALLLSNFTEETHALLLGVNAGGLGTLIASLASVISYKLYNSENANTSGIYLLKFTVVNIIFMILLIPLCLLFVNR